MYSNTCFDTNLYSAGIHHRNLLKLLVSMSRLTYLIINTIKKQGEDLGKNDGEWTRKVEIRTRKKCVEVGEAYVAIF